MNNGLGDTAMGLGDDGDDDDDDDDDDEGGAPESLTGWSSLLEEEVFELVC